MSNDWINIRVGLYHLHVSRFRPFISIARNDYWRGRGGPWVAVYQLFGWRN